MSQRPWSEPSGEPPSFWRWAATSIQPSLGWILAGLGGFCLLLGWIGVSREVLVAKQLPYLVSGGFGGLALVFFGAKLIDTRDLRRYEDRLEHLEAVVDDLYDLLLAEREPGDDQEAAVHA